MMRTRFVKSQGVSVPTCYSLGCRPGGFAPPWRGDARLALEANETDKTHRCTKSKKISPENIYNGRNEPPILQNIESGKFHAFRATERDERDRQYAPLPEKPKIPPENIYKGRNEPANFTEYRKR